MGSLLNFRCPDDLWASIEKLGKDRHPGGTHHRSQRDYDLTSTMLDIVRAGISALEDDPSLLNKTDGKTINKTEVQEMINQAIAASQTENKTIDKTEIQSMIQAAISSAISSMATKKDLSDFEETVLNLIEEKPATPIKEKFPSEPGYNQNNVTTTALIEVKEGELKSYNQSIDYIIELSRQKTPQKKIVEALNDGNYSTKSGSGKWTQSMVSAVITSRTAKFTTKG